MFHSLEIYKKWFSQIPMHRPAIGKEPVGFGNQSVEAPAAGCMSVARVKGEGEPGCHLQTWNTLRAQV